jgi:NADPH2 dehydrogenase
LLVAEATFISAAHAIICQLVAPGRAADVQASVDDGQPLLSASAVAMPGDGFVAKSGPVPVPREMTKDEIHACVYDFIQASQNAILAGFDGVELHGANGYQDTCNILTDQWEGALRIGHGFH